jgi:hypothetical protein
VNDGSAFSRASRSLHARLLGEAFEKLPAAVRDLHNGAPCGVFRGLAKVERGVHPIARLAAWLIGFPKAGSGVPVCVAIEASSDREIWRRDFAGRCFESELSLSREPNSRILVERFGPARVGLALNVDNDRLCIVPCWMTLFGVRLPAALAPKGETYECEVEAQFSFHVEIMLPLIGHLVSYRGQLVRT